MTHDQAQAELPRYRCHKEVWALKIKELRFVPECQASPEQEGNKAFTLMIPDHQGYSAIALPDGFVDRHKPQIGGYYVVYRDGYKSYSPAKAFEDGYTLIE